MKHYQNKFIYKINKKDANNSLRNFTNLILKFTSKNSTHPRWTRASSYLRNRTTQLLMRLNLLNNNHNNQPQVIQQQQNIPSHLPQNSQITSQPYPKPINPLLDHDGMDILTDYSTLAYYILSNPGSIVNEAQVAPEESAPVDFRFVQSPPVARITGPDQQNDLQNAAQNSYSRI